MTNKSTIPTIQLQMEFDEEWRDIPGYEEFYEVSNKGRVRTKKSRLRGYDAGTLLFQTATADGYLGTTLLRNSEKKRINVHRLVMLAFVGEPGELDVNHKNGIKADNRLENLEYVTHLENMRHSLHVLKVYRAQGERHGSARLNADQVRDIRRRAAAGETRKALAQEFQVTTTAIATIVLRRRWKHID